MSGTDPIVFRPRNAGFAGHAAGAHESAYQTRFNRQELTTILDLYGRKVAAGAWRDYSIDHLRDVAIFSVFRRSSEQPLYRIIKDSSLIKKQGAYSVVATGGLIMKRGPDLARVLRVLEDRLDLVTL